jgi:hypothetical protein
MSTDNVTRLRSAETGTRIGVLESQVQNIGYTIEKLEQRVDHQYETLHSRISDLRDDVRKEISDNHNAVIKRIDDQAIVDTEQHREIADRMREVEKWRWILVGAAIVLGYFLAHMKIENLF